MEHKKSSNVLLSIFLVIVFGMLLLHLSGVIDVGGLLNPESPRYLRWWEVWQPVKETPYDIPKATCPKTTCDITTPCCGHGGTGINDPAVLAVPIPMACPCPEDTKSEPIGIDRTAPGGPYNICGCK